MILLIPLISSYVINDYDNKHIKVRLNSLFVMSMNINNAQDNEHKKEHIINISSLD